MFSASNTWKMNCMQGPLGDQAVLVTEVVTLVKERINKVR